MEDGNYKHSDFSISISNYPKCIFVHRSKRAVCTFQVLVKWMWLDMFIY